ncbi:MAG: BamA/TamA family outer membrane protein [Pirellulales bacterium]|nr:BamA/TamA family outer membrane protein [Pirellulales bacterium]
MADLHKLKHLCIACRFGRLPSAAVAMFVLGWVSTAVAQTLPEPPGQAPTGAAAVDQSEERPADAESEMVVDVRIAGNKSVPLEKILPHIKTRAGRPYDGELVVEDVRRLDRTGLFVDIKPNRKRVMGGWAVIFDVVERPLLQEVKFIGCKEIRKKTLQKETNLKAGDPMDAFAVEEARRKIEELYRERGYSGARATIIEGDKPDDRRAIFVINEGIKQKVGGVKFVGNEVAGDDRLKSKIKSKPPFLYLFKGELDRKELEEDVNRLTDYYRGLGFFAARISRELSYNDEKNWVTITFVIDEGPRYEIRNVSVIGNEKYSSEELMAELKLRGGEFFNRDKMTADIGSLRDKYGSVGYVFADVKADPRLLEEPGKLDLVYNIKEGEPYRVGKINIRIEGEYPHTQLATIRSRLSFNPGEIIDIREIRASEVRLQRSGLFETNPAQGQPPKIVFHPPGEESEERVAERPQRPAAGDDRGRGPRPPSERSVDITLDCGPLKAKGVDQSGEGRVEETPRDCVAGAKRTGVAGPSAVEKPRDEVLLAAAEFTDVLSHRNGRRRSLDGVIHTQYTPDAGRVNPATMPQSATQSTPATERQPEYVSQRWPREGATRPVETPEGATVPGPIFDESSPFIGGPPEGGDTLRTLDFEVLAHEAMTGRMMFGVGINSDAGLVGQIVIDEQNFDWTRFPRGWEDIRNATAFRGKGQRFRIEAMPGTELQRYMINFQEPYLFYSQINLGLSGYYYNRSYREWYEQRIGGRVALGYQFAPDLSGSVAYRGAKINITDVIDPTLPQFAEVLGRDLSMHGFQAAIAHDKRDSAFLPTQGHLIEMSFEQVIGSYVYPRAEIDLRKYFMLHEHIDGGSRHVLSLAARAGYSGEDTPIYENFYAGGFSSLRGFEFRGVAPHVYSAYAGQDVFVGGKFQLLASAEYMFPITADDMIRGVVFCDTGAVQPTICDWADNYRVAPGFGLRIAVPAMGPAPIALDFAFPVSWQPGDRFEVFSFFVGFGR